jgi:hypothetical protein
VATTGWLSGSSTPLRSLARAWATVMPPTGILSIETPSAIRCERPLS